VTVSRKLVALLATLFALAGCTSGIEQLHLKIATGFQTGVYNALGNALADEWATQTGMSRPEVLTTEGSGENVRKLAAGEADIAFSAADVANDEQASISATNGGHGKFSALTRIYDDYLHIAVRDESPIRAVGDLAGKRVSIGAPRSGVKLIAERVLGIAEVTGQFQELGLRESADALRRDQIDAFFWSGGLPTGEITQLARDTNIRLLDMGQLMPAVRAKYSYYSAAAIPLSTYPGLKNPPPPPTTLIVPNLLLVTDRLSVDAARTLTAGIFEAQPRLASRITAAYSIDVRAAIETLPIQLHPGALEYYRDQKR
jgi:uncharacterized protein